VLQVAEKNADPQMTNFVEDMLKEQVKLGRFAGF
jgi:hypothetical protein